MMASLVVLTLHLSLIQLRDLDSLDYFIVSCKFILLLNALNEITKNRPS